MTPRSYNRIIILLYDVVLLCSFGFPANVDRISLFQTSCNGDESTLSMCTGRDLFSCAFGSSDDAIAVSCDSNTNLVGSI